MLDRTIPFYNIILRLDSYTQTKDSACARPDNIVIRGYRPGDEEGWAALHTETGDFASIAEAKQYFLNTYAHDTVYLSHRAMFALEQKTNRIIGTCTAWRDHAKPSVRGQTPFVSSLHWLAVTESMQHRGIGRALCQAVVNIFAQDADLEFPVYIHTQPWSYRAILLYASLGFRLQKTDTFAAYENQYDDAICTLQTLLSPEQFQFLWENSQP